MLRILTRIIAYVVYKYQITMLYTKKQYNVMCQLIPQLKKKA